MFRKCCHIVLVSGILFAPAVGALQIQLDLEVSRSNGAAPLAVFFDASGTTHLDSQVKPFHDLGFEWDFGDPAAGAWTPSGKDKNWATGAVAAHVFEDPGVYTVTVNARYIDGERVSASVEITVLDTTELGWTTYYVSSSQGSDDNDGLTREAAFETLARAFAEQGAKRRILLKRGDEWTVLQSLEVTAAGPGLIAGYDSGALPRIVSAIPGTDCGLIDIDSSDWRVQDLELAATGPGSQCVAIGIGAGRSNVLILGNQVSGFRVGLGNEWSTSSDALFWVDNQVEDIELNGAYLGGNRLAIMGNQIGQIETSHVLRVWYARKGVIGSNRLFDPSTGSVLNRLALKFHTDNALSSDPAELVVIADNTLRGDGWVSSFAPQDDWADEEIRDLVIERNRFIATADTASSIVLEGHHMTVRNNVFSGSNGSRYYSAIQVRNPAGLSTPVGDIDFEHNSITRADTVTGYSEFTAFLIDSGVERLRFRNNILHKTQSVDWNYAFQLVDLATVAQIDSDFNLVSLASSQFANIAGVGYDLVSWQTTFGLDLASLEVDDLGFIDAAAGDLHLAAGSQAIQAADVCPVFEDLDATPRPLGGDSDIGAFEYSGDHIFMDGFELGNSSKWDGKSP